MKIITVIRSAAAAAVLVFLAAGIPLALAKLGSNPLPHHVPNPAEIWRLLLSRDDGSLFIRVFTLVGWAAWASFALGLIAELPTLFGIRAWRLPGLSAQQHLAGLLLAAIISSSAAGTALLTRPAPHHSAGPTASRHPVAVAAATITPRLTSAVNGHSAAPTVLTPSHARPAVLTPGSYVEHTVTRTDSLLDLAERFYGDPLQFQKILDATYGLPQPDGKTLHRGQTFLYAGWTVRIPTLQTASTNGEAKPSTPPGVDRQQTSPIVYQVAHDDYLWFIAQRFLGDPHTYPAIAALNPGLIPDTAGPHGPDHIQPGWRLTLPADAHDRGARPHANGHVLPPRPEPALSPSPAEKPESQLPSGLSPTSGATPAPATSGSVAPAIPHSTPPAAEATGTAAVYPPAATPDSAAHENPTPPGSDTNGSTEPAVPDSASHAPAGTTAGMRLSSWEWISTGLVVLIGTVGLLRRLQLRRIRRLVFPIPPYTGPAASPMPESLRAADLAGQANLTDAHDTDLPGQMKEPPSQSAPIGVDHTGEHVSLYRYAGIALDGAGSTAATRGVLAGALCTGMLELIFYRFVVVTTTDLMARLLPPEVTPGGLDPNGDTFDQERLHLHDSADDALSRVEAEAIARRRVLEGEEVSTVAELVATDYMDEHVTPWLLVLPAATSGHLTDRLAHVVEQAQSLNIRLAILGTSTLVPTATVDSDGLVTGEQVDPADLVGLARLSTLSADDLADLLNVLSQTASRPLDDVGTDQPKPPVEPEQPSPIPVRGPDQTAAPVRLQVLGPVSACTDAGVISKGISGAPAALLAVLAAHPEGKTVASLAAILHESDNDAAAAEAKVRTTMGRVRSVLRAASGLTSAEFIVKHPGRTFRLDPHLFDVDLWRMFTAIDAANKADDEQTCLAALQEAVGQYHGDFANNQSSQTWFAEYASEPRHRYLCALTRIAEILEPDQPDQAIAVLERAIRDDPLNEEVYQRLFRIQGRTARPEDVRRTLNLLDNRLWEIQQSEMSETTRRIAERQLSPRRRPQTGQAPPEAPAA